MNTALLKQLGNIDQLAGIRESTLLRGRGQDIHIAEFYNAAGLRFTVVPDRCMDVYDFSYKGINLSFHSKNGLVSPQSFSAAGGEFSEQWSGGMLVTCGLDNVGNSSHIGGNYPAHGRIGYMPAQNFGTQTRWEADRYVLRATGEVHQTQMYGRHLSVQRTIETSMDEKCVRFHDIITNFDSGDEPYMLLYHFNFGYPLLQPNSRVQTSRATLQPLTALCDDPTRMLVPEDGRGEESWIATDLPERCVGVIYNEELELGAYLAWDTENLPGFLEWKNMKTHDYVLAIEPCNTSGLNRDAASAQGKLAVLPAFSSVENRLELGVLEGLTEIRQFLANL